MVGDGTDGVVKVTVSGNGVSAVEVEDPGSGYTYATVPFKTGVPLRNSW